MLNTNINYPYPLLREYNEDYKNTVFIGDLKVMLRPDCYVISTNFKIENTELSELIASGVLTYAIEVQCVSTWFRKLFRVKDKEIIKLNPELIHERVEVTPCIIANSDIPNFINSDFEEEYKGMNFNIRTGDIIGIGTKKTFDALYQNDIIKNGSSIVEIKGSDDVKNIACDYSGNIITITLPTNQYNDYRDCGYNKSKYTILNAIISIPALVEVIDIIAYDYTHPDETSGYENKSWYKTIVSNLKRYTENNQNKYGEILSSPFSAAEILLGNNSEAALNFLCHID